MSLFVLTNHVVSKPLLTCKFRHPLLCHEKSAGRKGSLPWTGSGRFLTFRYSEKPIANSFGRHFTNAPPPPPPPSTLSASFHLSLLFTPWHRVAPTRTRRFSPRRKARLCLMVICGVWSCRKGHTDRQNP